MFKSRLLFFCVFATFLSTLCFAQETFTITTYYPSPFGSYNELTANRMAVGSTAVMPVNDGDLNVSGKIREGGSDLVPAGAIILWTDAACPNGYSRFTGVDNRFLVSAAAYNSAAGGADNRSV